MVRNAPTPEVFSTLRTPTVHFPDGRIVPPVLTSEEVCELLRLPLAEGQDGTKRLEFYRRKGLLRGVSLGHAVRFTLVEVMAFIDKQMSEIKC